MQIGVKGSEAYQGILSIALVQSSTLCCQCWVGACSLHCQEKDGHASVAKPKHTVRIPKGQHPLDAARQI